MTAQLFLALCAVATSVVVSVITLKAEFAKRALTRRVREIRDDTAWGDVIHLSHRQGH
jgi:hypothetical protein